MEVERRATDSAPARYRPRRPSRSVLYRCVQEHLETWLAQCRDGHDDEWSVPEYVEREFRRYLDCGILAHGFAHGRSRDRCAKTSRRSRYQATEQGNDRGAPRRDRQ